MSRNKKVFPYLAILLLIIFIIYIGRNWLFEEDMNLNVLTSCSSAGSVGIIDGVSHHITGAGMKEGFLSLGQNIPLKKGYYRVSYKIRLNNFSSKDASDKKIGYCDVNVINFPEYNTRFEFANKEFAKDNPRKIILSFSVPEGFPAVGFRVFQYGGNNLSVESTRLYSIVNKKLPVRTKEFKKVIMYLIGIIFLFAVIVIFIILKFKKFVFFLLFFLLAEFWFLKIEKATDIGLNVMYSPVGKIDSLMHIRANDTKEGYLAYGPYLALIKGAYKVKYKIFLDNFNPTDIPSRKIGYCDVDIEGHPEIGSSTEFTFADFKKKNPMEVTLKFSVPDGMPKTQYRVYQFGGNKLSLLSLKLYDIDVKKYSKEHLDIILVVLFVTLFFI
ncbi:MAG: hypothetical protein Q7K21_05365 [Elusimicrobiota bacterium]|nr:hypothetical protein [Elusimicrobiota bacterium]